MAESKPSGDKAHAMNPDAVAAFNEAVEMAGAPLHVLSLGAGVQSTTMALMAARGEIEPMPDAAIFADTGAEPKAVYEHLDWLRSPNVLPFPVEVVRAGDIRSDTHSALNGGRHCRGRAATAPFFTLGRDGRAAPLRRQCTAAYKVEPINRRIREYLGVKARRRVPAGIPPVVVWLGISTDEIHRMKPAREWWVSRHWPLVDARMSRNDCLCWLERHGYATPPRSACIFCPYRSDREWRWLRDHDPEGWEEAVAIDRAIRPGFPRINSERSTGELYLHRSLAPLEDVDFRTASERGQLDLFGNECEGMCGL